MFLTGDATFASFGLATILVVAVAVLGSLTVLPALLSKLGDRVDRLRVPLVGRLRRDDGEGRIWGAIVDRVLRRPLLSAVLAGGLLLALAAPGAAAAHAPAGAGDVPEVARGREDLRPHAAGVPRAARCPANVVVKAPDVNAPAVRGGDRPARAAGARERPRSYEPITVDVNADGTVANITVPIDGNGSRRRVERGARASSATRSCPQTVGALPNTEAGVTGLDGRVEGLGRRDEVEPAARRRVRARARVRADAGRLPLDRRRGQGDRAQPALGRRRLRRARARLPARRRQGPARLRLRPPASTRSCRCCCS